LDLPVLMEQQAQPAQQVQDRLAQQELQAQLV
jgi:hypothetical protein